MIKEMCEKITKEDIENAKLMDFEGLKCEIDDGLLKFVDMIHFGRADDEDIVIIDATMTTVHDIISEGKVLIRERHVQQ